LMVRRAASDAEMQAFVSRLRKVQPKVTRSRALRTVRDTGIACGQERFSRLWESVADAKGSALRHPPLLNPD
jgi:hypothetical protein